MRLSLDVPPLEATDAGLRGDLSFAEEPPALEHAVAETIARMRGAQSAWSEVPVRRRVAIVARLRRRLVEHCDELVSLVELPQRTRSAETVSAEIIPLADACRFLERRAERLLRTRHESPRENPGWLRGIRLQIARAPLGVVLVIGTWNYPLLLTGVQTLQALVAGNGVLIKPGANTTPITMRLRELLLEAGLPAELLAVLPERVDAVDAAIAAGVDHVVLTGSARTGAAVLGKLAPRLIPATMELSGCDAVFVQPGADLSLVTRGLVFGLRFNSSATCLAPRRVLVTRPLAAPLERAVSSAVSTLPAMPITAEARSELCRLVRAAVREGARLVSGDDVLEFDEGRGPPPGDRPGSDGQCRIRPVIVADARPDMELLQTDLFAPVLSLVAVDDDDQALIADAQCPYALAATVFGPRQDALALAKRLRAGTVVINDLLAPTADPRVPFGGTGMSGFGTTRGAEGLLALTRPQARLVQRSTFLPHLDAPHAQDESLLRGYLRLAHGAGLGNRLRGLGQFVKAVWQRK